MVYGGFHMLFYFLTVGMRGIARKVNMGRGRI
jgi:hypothetical protein